MLSAPWSWFLCIESSPYPVRGLHLTPSHHSISTSKYVHSNSCLIVLYLSSSPRRCNLWIPQSKHCLDPSPLQWMAVPTLSMIQDRRAWTQTRSITFYPTARASRIIAVELQGPSPGSFRQGPESVQQDFAMFSSFPRSGWSVHGACRQGMSFLHTQWVFSWASELGRTANRPHPSCALNQQ